MILSNAGCCRNLQCCPNLISYLLMFIDILRVLCEIPMITHFLYSLSNNDKVSSKFSNIPLLHLISKMNEALGLPSGRLQTKAKSNNHLLILEGWQLTRLSNLGLEFVRATKIQISSYQVHWRQAEVAKREAKLIEFLSST